MVQSEYLTFRYSRVGKLIQSFLLLSSLGFTLLFVWLADSYPESSIYLLGFVCLAIFTIGGIVSVFRFALIMRPDTITKRTLITQTIQYDSLTKIDVLATHITLSAGWTNLAITRETEQRERILEILAQKIAHRRGVLIRGDNELIEKYFGKDHIG